MLAFLKRLLVKLFTTDERILSPIFSEIVHRHDLANYS